MSAARHLRVVAPEPGQEYRPSVHFCGHCGEHLVGDMPVSRVCSRCALGMYLEADADAAPRPGEPFLVVDPKLFVCALSQGGEDLLGVQEPDAVNRHITDFLVTADVEGPGPEALVAGILRAGHGETLRTVLRPVGEFGVRLFARLSVCGPARSVLIVVDDG
jgi:hypothetical protein